MDKIHKIKEAKTPEILDRKNVVGVGVGKKITNGEQTNEDSILVFVEKKADPSVLSTKDLVPEEIDGVKTDVIEVGKLRPMSHRQKQRPVYGGISAIHYKGTACTLGAIVYRGEKAYALQNAHCGYPHWQGAQKGDPILQPSPMDGGQSSDVIGNASEVEEIKFDGTSNLMDACLVELTVDAEPLKQDSYDVPVSENSMTVSVGEEVIKSGRTTGHQAAKVIAVDVTAQVYYDDKVAIFTNQIITENEGRRFISGGDSSSLVCNKEGRPVGLVFAGSDRVGIFTPIQPVIDRFNITFTPRKNEGYIALKKLTNKRDYVEIHAEFAKKGNVGNLDYHLNLRREGSVFGEKFTTLKPSTKFEILDDPFERDGYVWAKVKTWK